MIKSLGVPKDFAKETVAHKSHTYTHCDHLIPFQSIEPDSFTSNQLPKQTFPQIEVHEDFIKDGGSFDSTLFRSAELIDNFCEKKSY